MNWTTLVKGTNIIDFQGRQLADTRKHILETSNKSMKDSYRILGWHHRLRLPVPQNPINTTSWGLETVQYKNWTSYFWETALESGGPCQVANVERALLSPLSCTGSSTVHMTWTYDPEIQFRAAKS